MPWTMLCNMGGTSYVWLLSPCEVAKVTEEGVFLA